MCEYALAHHGIKGQKWGVRRYQNPDGSLTPEGIERYGLHKDRPGYFTKNVRESARRSAGASAKATFKTQAPLSGIAGVGIAGDLAVSGALPLSPALAAGAAAFVVEQATATSLAAVIGGTSGGRQAHKQDKYVRKAVENGRAFIMDSRYSEVQINYIGNYARMATKYHSENASTAYVKRK